MRSDAGLSPVTVHTHHSFPSKHQYLASQWRHARISVGLHSFPPNPVTDLPRGGPPPERHRYRSPRTVQRRTGTTERLEAALLPAALGTMVQHQSHSFTDNVTPSVQSTNEPQHSNLLTSRRLCWTTRGFLFISSRNNRKHQIRPRDLYVYVLP